MAWFDREAAERPLELGRFQRPLHYVSTLWFLEKRKKTIAKGVEMGSMLSFKGPKARGHSHDAGSVGTGRRLLLATNNTEEGGGADKRA